MINKESIKRPEKLSKANSNICERTIGEKHQEAEDAITDTHRDTFQQIMEEYVESKGDIVAIKKCPTANCIIILLCKSDAIQNRHYLINTKFMQLS